MDKNKLKLTISLAIFGTIGLVRKYIPYSSGIVVFSRAFIGAVFMTLYTVIKREKINFTAVKNNLGYLILSGGLLGLDWSLLFESYKYTSVSVATVSYYMAPVFLMIASPLLLREKIDLKKGICAGVSMVGMVLVSGVIETGFAGIKGVLLALGGAVVYAVIVVKNKKFKGLGANERTIFQLAFASVAIVPYILLTEDITRFSPSLDAILLLVLAGVVHTGIAYAFYFGSLPYVRAQTVALFSYIDPILAVVLSAVVLKEKMSVLTLIGVVTVILSTMISEMDFKKNKEKA